MEEVGRDAVAASRILANANTAKKNTALKAAAVALRAGCKHLLAGNKIDMDGGRKKGLTSALMDRLELTAARIEAMAKGLEDIAALDDPVGATMASWDRPKHRC